MLTGKIAVVTGASRGIGKEIAKTLAAKGATVVVNYNGSAEKAEETVKEIEALGGKAEALQCNVSDYDKAAEMMAYVVKTYGRVDILVNNAGITRDNLLMKMSEEDFDAVLNTNLKGAFNCIKHISRQMLKQKSGHIVNISSVSGVMGNAGQVNYSASKAGVIGMTKAVAREMASRGITCNAVAPGFIKTDMTEVLSDTIKENISAQIPMRAFGETADVANLVAFLASVFVCEVEPLCRKVGVAHGVQLIGGLAGQHRRFLVHVRQSCPEICRRLAAVGVVVQTDQVFFFHGEIHSSYLHFF